MTYYRSTVVEIGEEAGEMAAAGVLILFGEPLPEALAEVSIVHRPTQTLQGHGIAVGDVVVIGGQELTITAVGELDHVSSPLLLACLVPQLDRVRTRSVVLDLTGLSYLNAGGLAVLAAAAGRTTFVIAHRLATIRDADRILFFKDGVIAEAGSFDELVAQDGQFAALARTQLLAPAKAEEAPAPHLHLVYSRPEVAGHDNEDELLACAG